MAGTIDIHFQSEAALRGGDAVVLTDAELRLGEATAARIGPEAAALVARAAAAERFTGRDRTALVIPAPAGLDLDRLVVVGLGPAKERAAHDWLQLGGFVSAKLAGRTATILLDPPGPAPDPEAAAELALGMRLRAYAFDRYKTKRKDDDPERDAATRLTLVVPDAAAAERAYGPRRSLAEGVCLARDLVNEPGNVLGPEELAARAAAALAGTGVEVEVFDRAELERRGFRALLAAGQGSDRESRVVVMRWMGGGAEPPVAFIGKGVCFDSGGISIKPAAGMEDMKGDMAGAACVIGLMQALAARGARANVVGAIGLIENMPGGHAQRPGDIVTTLSGQTVEIVNTDAEGRLVLADVLAHVAAEHKPRLMVDLATLTGAIIVTLGHEYAGLLSNNDELAERLTAAGQATGERLWRLPMGPEFDKMIDSKFADMKNSGGRLGGSITAAQFLARFVGDIPWAHLDIAGLGFNSPQSEINRSWGSGFGVRLLDRLVRDHYEG